MKYLLFLSQLKLFATGETGDQSDSAQPAGLRWCGANVQLNGSSARFTIVKDTSYSEWSRRWLASHWQGPWLIEKKCGIEIDEMRRSALTRSALGCNG